jgi:hypothetical protein
MSFLWVTSESTRPLRASDPLDSESPGTNSGVGHIAISGKQHDKAKQCPTPTRND